MDLGVKTFSTAPEYFEAGTNIGIAKAVMVAGEAIPAHAPVARGADGKLAKVTADNLAGIYGLLPEAAAAKEETVVYLTGEFFANSLVLEKGITVKDVEVSLRNIGIFLK